MEDVDELETRMLKNTPAEIATTIVRNFNYYFINYLSNKRLFANMKIYCNKKILTKCKKKAGR